MPTLLIILLGALVLATFFFFFVPVKDSPMWINPSITAANPEFKRPKVSLYTYYKLKRNHDEFKN